MIYVDADGCPVKEEIYKVAERLQVAVVLVDKKARSQFLGSMDRILQALKRA